MRAASLAMVSLLFGVGISAVPADEHGTHLEPYEGPFVSGGADDYNGKVRETLLGDLPDRDFLVVSLPSFQPEWAVVVAEPDGATALVEFREAKPQIWGNEDPAKQATRSASVHISRETARVLREVWTEMLLATRHKREPVLGFDGVSWHFATWTRGIGARSGQIWSPPGKSFGGRLVALAESLRELATGASANRVAEEEQMRSAAAALLAELRAAQQDPK